MKIALVEDDKNLAGYIAKGLEEEQYTIDTYHDGVTAVYWCIEKNYDLIILDLMIPGIDGFEVCKKIREKGKLVPILILSARDSIDDKIKGLDEEADDYLAKPFVFGELLARIRALLRRNQLHSSPILKVADLELNPSSHNVNRAGKEIELTGKEYALLEFLIRNKNKILTETTIKEQVWGIDFETDTNIVNVYIYYLRNKIDKGHDKKLIHTIRSIGYTIKGDKND